MFPCLDLGLFMSYLCNLFSFLSSFSLLLIAYLINTDTLALFFIFLEYVLLFLDDNVDEESE